MQDRGAAIRVCPIFGRDGAAQQFNVEYRVADAAASPYLALGALVWAGVDGIRNNRSLPPMPERSLWDMSEAERFAAGAAAARSLDEAPSMFEAGEEAREWFGETFFDAYLCSSAAELSAVEG